MTAKGFSGGRDREGNRPESGKIYRLIGMPGEPSIANGDTWAESELDPAARARANDRREAELRAAVKWCSHCNGYGSSLKEAADRCSKCGGTGLAR